MDINTPNPWLMPDPWVVIREKSYYLLKSDKAFISKIYRDKKLKPEHKFHFKLLPEPFLGRVDAPIIILNLNPGYSECDRRWHRKQVFKELSLANLAHNAAEYPFYPLHPKIRCSPGGMWWSARFKPLINSLTNTNNKVSKEEAIKKIANGILCVEYFPYHSEKWRSFSIDNEMPSQSYSFKLVQAAISRENPPLILLLRNKKGWFENVQGLANMEFNEASNKQGRLHVLKKGTRSTHISEKNFPNCYHKVVATLSNVTI